MKFHNPIHFFINAKYYFGGLWHLQNLRYLKAITFFQKGLTHAQKNKFPVMN